ncbi:MAG: hypothetical protein ACXWB9_03535 [Flavisolibacter sp.]
MMMLTDVFMDGIVLNILALLLLLFAWKQPRVAKLLFSIMFAGSAITNLVSIITNAQGLAGNEHQVIAWFYDQVIYGFFRSNNNWILTSLIILQVLISISLIMRGWFYITGVITAIILLGSIIPLGITAAFPATFIMALALTRLLRFNHHYFWYVPRRIWN